MVPEARSGRRNLTARVMAIVVFGVGAVVLSMLVLTRERVGGECSAFRPTAAAWSGDGFTTSHRLVECESLSGRTREQVFALLGRPTRNGVVGSNRVRWFYRAGAQGPLLDEYLELRFGPTGRVERASIVEGD